MKYPLSELIDRYSILLLKSERLKDESVDSELKRFWGAISEGPVKAMDVAQWIGDMKAINGRIWDLESDIRKGKEGLLGVDEVGRRALVIRDINKERISYKNKIADKMGEFKEIKIDHGSA